MRARTPSGVAGGAAGAAGAANAAGAVDVVGVVDAAGAVDVVDAFDPVDARPSRPPRVRARDALTGAVLLALILPLLALPAGPLSAQEPERRPERPADPHGTELPVVEHELGNGMRFLVLRREGAPTVSFVTQFEVGSVNEALGSTGIAHLLEHMLFKGTTTIGTRDAAAERALLPRIDAVADSLSGARARGDTARAAALEARLEALEDSARAFVVPNELDRILTRHGARGLNATTSAEATTYYVQLPANRAKLWFLLESERMRDPVLREFYTERDVVAEERRMRVETAPGGRLHEALMATAFRVHPYGVPVIGHMSDIRNLTRPQAEDYFRRYYGPNNAVVAVVGDIEPDSIVAWAERYFGPIPRGEEPRRAAAVEPPQRGERRVEVLFDAEPQLAIGWHVPSALHPDAAPLSVLASLLVGGSTSRLHRRLVVEERIAQSVSAFTAPGARDPRLFIVAAAPRAPHTAAEVERAVYEEIERLKAEPPAADELQRIRNQLEASNVRRLQTGFGLALQLADSEALHGDWRETFRSTARLAAVEAADVQRVARKYLVRANRTVATLVREEDGAGDEALQPGASAERGGAVRP